MQPNIKYDILQICYNLIVNKFCEKYTAANSNLWKIKPSTSVVQIIYENCRKINKKQTQPRKQTQVANKIVAKPLEVRRAG